ncbi:hypothetical protein [Rheinheimera texasensis]|uniref:hypothetical protein n=1 Tax=Rheinheimera texasensis TaxID=306205 RepID=UPI0004E1167D|nr:hypothetical protein [Rheinheimera texasensis]
MLSLDVAQLKTHNLSNLIQMNWYAQELARWQAEAAQFDIVSYKEMNRFTSPIAAKKVNELVERQCYLEAAICLQIGSEGERTPLISAIQFDDVNLVMACLALGNKVEQRVWGETSFPLTEAMILNNVDIFNLLLLVPNIDVNVEAEVEGEFDDISQFLGMGEQYDYYRPVETLLSAAYAPILTSLNIDTEKRYGPQKLPLMVHAYRNNNIRLMNWLVFCGADINPYLDDYYGGGPNLINLALYDYLTYKDERHKQLLKWFSRFAKLLNARSELSSSLVQDLIESAESDAPELIDWFDLEPVAEFKQEMEEELDALTLKYDELKAEFSDEKQKIAALARATNQHQANNREEVLRVSLLEELKRVHRVEVSELLEDIFVEIHHTVIAFGLSYDSDLIYLEVQNPDEQHIEELVSAQELLTYSKFQLMVYFLSLPDRFWFKLSLLAELQGGYPFKSIDGNYLVTEVFAESFLERVGTGDINGLDRNEWEVLYKYLNTLATEVDIITGNSKLAKVVEDLCREKVWTAFRAQHYFADFEIKSVKDAESKVFENLRPMFDRLSLTANSSRRAIFS